MPEARTPRPGTRFVEVTLRRAVLRPLGATRPERRVDLGAIRSLGLGEIHSHAILP